MQVVPTETPQEEQLASANTTGPSTFGDKLVPPAFMQAPEGVSFVDEMNGKVNGWPQSETQPLTEEERNYRRYMPHHGWGSASE